ncbi:MAG: ABC transporter substrate-binding protein [Chloroflexi bacterium]|nr:ABC transporter substrate-binding protein [Chloroflexota bacterium]
MRRFYRGGFATLVLLLSMLLVFAACGGDDEDTGSGASTPADPVVVPTVADTGSISSLPTAVPSDTSSSSGSSDTSAPAPEPTAAMMEDKEPVVERLVLADGPPSEETNNPWGFESPRGPYFMNAIYDSLIAVDPLDGSFLPGLAEEFSVEPDGTSIRLKLRQGVQFHGGNGEFTAADVVATHIQQTRDDADHTHRSQYRAVEPIVINDYEVVLKTDQPNPELVPNLSERNVISFEILSGKDMEALGGLIIPGDTPTLADRLPAGTGPYEFVEREQSVRFVMQASGIEHWRYQPQFPEIEYRFIGEASTKLAGVVTGEIHMAQFPQDLKEQAVGQGMAIARSLTLARERALFVNHHVFDKSYSNYETQNTACGFVHCDQAFRDVRVRRAMSKAINRDEINDVYYGGQGTEVHNPHLVPTASYWNPEWDRDFESEYGYDPVAARQLLADAGYGPNNPLEVLIDGTPSSGVAEKADQAETILGYFQDIGIKAALDQRDAATTRAIARSFGETNRITFMTSNIYETQAFRVHHHSGTTPRGGPEFEGLEEAITAQRSTVNPVLALDGLRNVGDVSFPLHIAVPMFWAPDDIVYNPTVVASYERSGVPLGVFHSIQQIIPVYK